MVLYKRKIKINNEKYSHITFSLRQGIVSHISHIFCHEKLFQWLLVTSTYLLMFDPRKTLDLSRTYKTKNLFLNLRWKSHFPLLGKHFKLNLKIIYCCFTKISWSLFGFMVFIGSGKKTKIHKILMFQST